MVEREGDFGTEVIKDAGPELPVIDLGDKVFTKVSEGDASSLGDELLDLPEMFKSCAADRATSTSKESLASFFNSGMRASSSLSKLNIMNGLSSMMFGLSRSEKNWYCTPSVRMARRAVGVLWK